MGKVAGHGKGVCTDPRTGIAASSEAAAASSLTRPFTLHGASNTSQHTTTTQSTMKVKGLGNNRVGMAPELEQAVGSNPTGGTTANPASSSSPQHLGPPHPPRLQEHHHTPAPPSRAPSQQQQHPQHAHEPPAPPRNASEMYEQLLLGIIRPPRLAYEFPRALGPATLSFSDGTVCHRTDFEVYNGRGQMLGCSLWQPAGAEAREAWPCVVYLHGNSSSRVEAVKTNVLKSVMASGSALIGFDFTGCGNAEGDYISLGWHEATDTRHVLDELRRRGCGRVVLHGRSMGAVTALQYTIQACTASSSSSSSSSSPMIVPAGLILDSPFSGFKKLAYDLTSKGMVHIPSFATSTVLSFLRRSVRSRVGFDLFKLKPLKHVYHCTTVPALFLVAEDDELIPPWHAEGLRSKYGGPSLGIRFEGSHNSPRPAVVYALASLFIKTVNEREPRFGSVSVDLALHLMEKTAVVTSQQEEEEEEEEGHSEEIMQDLPYDDGYESDPFSPPRRRPQQQQQQQQQRRRRQRYRGPYRYYYDEPASSSSGGTSSSRTNTKGGGRLKKMTNKIKSNNGKHISTRKSKKSEGGVEGGPQFIHTGSRSVDNIAVTAKGLIGALDVNLAARAVEEYLLEELVAIAVAIVQTQVQAVVLAEQKEKQQKEQQQQEEGSGRDHAVLSALAAGPPLSKTEILNVGARTQRELAAAAPWASPSSSSSSSSKMKKQSTSFSPSKALGLSLTSWESVIYAEGPEQWNETRRIVNGLKQLHLFVPPGVALPASSSSISPAPVLPSSSPAASTPALAALIGTKFCCFDPRDAYLSEGQEKEAGLVRVAEAMFR